MKAYKIEVLVIDFEDAGETEIVKSLQNVRHINPQIKNIKSADIGEWSDAHPLNKRDECEYEYKKLFK